MKTGDVLEVENSGIRTLLALIVDERGSCLTVEDLRTVSQLERGGPSSNFMNRSHNQTPSHTGARSAHEAITPY
jgi:hypothetical protein